MAENLGQPRKRKAAGTLLKTGGSLLPFLVVAWLLAMYRSITFSCVSASTSHDGMLAR